jgi:aryl-alcohol dehydrogenase-like predicted oxidoreductase
VVVAVRPVLDLVEAIKAMAAEKGCTPAQLARAWLLAQWEHILPIPGTTRPERLEENIGALSVRIGDLDLASH